MIKIRNEEAADYRTVEEPVSYTHLAEMCAEYPDVKIDAVSDIDLFLNDEHLCTWQSPGDFGDRRGRYTPSWWHACLLYTSAF